MQTSAMKFVSIHLKIQTRSKKAQVTSFMMSLFFYFPIKIHTGFLFCTMKCQSDATHLKKENSKKLQFF